jgi:hypothetical protein
VPNPSVTLDQFVGVRQAQDQWCWAAVAASIHNYFATIAYPQREPLPQCVFVTHQLEALGGGCRKKSVPKACATEKCFNPKANRPSHLNWQLERCGLLHVSINCDGTDQVHDGKIFHGGFDAFEVAAAIDAGCPVALRVLLRIENGHAISHFLVIVGYESRSLERFVIWDSNFGYRYLTLNELLFLYGPLEQKYLTQQKVTV